MDDPDLGRTESQTDWADWAGRGYGKQYQPRSMLWAGGIFVVLLAAGLVTVIWLSVHGRLP
jgi:hypothetical protein